MIQYLRERRPLTGGLALDKDDPAARQRHDAIRDRSPARGRELLAHPAQLLYAPQQRLFDLFLKHFCEPYTLLQCDPIEFSDEFLYRKRDHRERDPGCEPMPFDVAC
jgi:hypothetical protein